MQPVNSCQLLETSQKAKAFQDTQRLWPTAQGAGTALCSQLPFRFWALGAWQWQNHVGTWCGGPGAGALAAASSRMLISASAWLFFFHFSFRWGWDSPAGKRKGKPQLIPPWYLDCSHWLLPAPCSQNSMEVQNWRWWCWWWWWINNGIFPESLRPGPLPALALLRHPSPHQLRAKLPRPLDRDFSTQWHYIQSVFPSAQTFFAGVLLYIPPPLQSRAACWSSCESLQPAASRSLRCTSPGTAGTLPGQAQREQRASVCPRPVAELDEDRILLFGRLSSTSNRAQRGQERYQRFSPCHIPLANFCWPWWMDACSGLSRSLPLQKPPLPWWRCVF